ncbi:hypothetical protein QL285_068219 [Trifolium repens]|nr:hypothetical protein QL285_068219 [Trifolium repens]
MQFGLWQEIPNEPINIDNLHQQDMRGNHHENWKDRHAEWIEYWNDRHNRCLTGQPIQGNLIPSNEYMIWLRENSKLYLSIPHQLHDPRDGFAEDSNASSSTKTHQTEHRRRNRRQQPTPPINAEYEESELQRQSFSFTPTLQREPARHSISFTPIHQQFEPGRHSISFTPTHQQFEPARHSISSNDDFVSNLFGVEMSTPESAAHYMNTLYSFGVPSNINQQGTSSSTVHVDLNAEEIQGPQEIQGLREIQGPRRGSRIRKPPTCGTHQRLGKK